MVKRTVLALLLVANAGLPASFAGWFAVAVFGLVLGLVASGFYKFISRTPKG